MSTGQRPGGPARAAVVAYVCGHPGATPAQVATATGLGREVVKKALQRLASSGTLRSNGRGHYYADGRRHRAPVPAVGVSTGPAGTASLPDPVSPSPVDAVTGVPDGKHGDISPPERWRCGQCHWLQAIGSVDHCEACGASRSRAVPR